MCIRDRLIVPFDGLQEIAPIPFIRKHQRRQLLQRVRTVKGPAFSGPIPVKNDLVLLASGLLQGIPEPPIFLCICIIQQPVTCLLYTSRCV